MDRILSSLDNAFLQENPNWKASIEKLNWIDINCLQGLVDETEKLLVKYPNPNSKVKGAIYGVFEEVVSRYPLLFGYWKKFVHIAHQVDGVEKSLDILKQSLDAFPTSLDLWNDYLQIVVTDEQDTEKVRGLFKTAEKLVGYHFLSHTFWDKYIEFETNNKEWSRVFAVYSHLAKIPLHQYAKYYTTFKALLDEHPEVVPGELKDTFDIETIFVQTQQLVNDVWKYESKITQSFYNLNPLPEEELNNWNLYLEFIVNDSRTHTDLAISAFERALVPCYHYEHFWQFYANWLMKNGDEAAVSQVLQRGMVAVPAEDNTLGERYIGHLKSLMHKDKDHYGGLYKDALVNFIPKYPTKDALIVDYLSAIKITEYYSSVMDSDEFIMSQQNAYTKFLEEVINAYFDRPKKRASSQLLSILNDHNIGVVIVQLLKMNWLVLKNAMQARKHFNHFSKMPQLKNSTAFWLLYYKFEKAHGNFTKLNKFVSQLGTEIFLPTTVINDIIQDYQSFYLSNNDIMEHERRLSVPQTWDPLIDATFKINDPQWKPYNKPSKDWYKSSTFKENGHPGISIDVPQINNSIVGKSIATIRREGTQPLPTFRNLEKINQQPKYIDFMGEYINT
ncbi:HFL261Cp [Eremothecium sinecaudum]|uniref:HFL261Cp n=1 Tax=Eremothecium sinecaudum TaxID=45286 RepID=A0A0X8HU90_9SACH|nr:HFL261Cp [Eremothecium sinecaudum]AMD21595.1 HFL261Cp [Eremothecium sinecaudum]